MNKFFLNTTHPSLIKNHKAYLHSKLFLMTHFTVRIPFDTLKDLIQYKSKTVTVFPLTSMVIGLDPKLTNFYSLILCTHTTPLK